MKKQADAYARRVVKLLRQGRKLDPLALHNLRMAFDHNSTNFGRTRDVLADKAPGLYALAANNPESMRAKTIQSIREGLEDQRNHTFKWLNNRFNLEEPTIAPASSFIERDIAAKNHYKRFGEVEPLDDEIIYYDTAPILNYLWGKNKAKYLIGRNRPEPGTVRMSLRDFAKQYGSDWIFKGGKTFEDVDGFAGNKASWWTLNPFVAAGYGGGRDDASVARDFLLLPNTGEIRRKTLSEGVSHLMSPDVEEQRAENLNLKYNPEYVARSRHSDIANKSIGYEWPMQPDVWTRYRNKVLQAKAYYDSTQDKTLPYAYGINGRNMDKIMLEFETNKYPGLSKSDMQPLFDKNPHWRDRADSFSKMRGFRAATTGNFRVLDSDSLDSVSRRIDYMLGQKYKRQKHQRHTKTTRERGLARGIDYIDPQNRSQVKYTRDRDYVPYDVLLHEIKKRFDPASLVRSSNIILTPSRRTGIRGILDRLLGRVPKVTETETEASKPRLTLSTILDDTTIENLQEEIRRRNALAGAQGGLTTYGLNDDSPMAGHQAQYAAQLSAQYAAQQAALQNAARQATRQAPTQVHNI